jgi:hypothetical protein
MTTSSVRLQRSVVSPFGSSFSLTNPDTNSSSSRVLDSCLGPPRIRSRFIGDLPHLATQPTQDLASESRCLAAVEVEGGGFSHRGGGRRERKSARREDGTLLSPYLLSPGAQLCASSVSSPIAGGVGCCCLVPGLGCNDAQQEVEVCSDGSPYEIRRLSLEPLAEVMEETLYGHQIRLASSRGVARNAAAAQGEKM